jgi:hypothetical protein
MPNKKRIYLDHGASTPVHPQVLEAMLPHWTENHDNFTSTREYGRSHRSRYKTYNPPDSVKTVARFLICLQSFRL